MPERYRTGSLQEVFQLIETTRRQLKRLQADTLRATGLTPPQYFILSLLWDEDGRPFKDLANLLNSSRATITEIVDSLENKGLVMRAPNPADRRSLLVKLTPQGQAMRIAAPSLPETFHDCCSGLDPEETKQLGQLLKKLNRSLHYETGE